MIRIRPLVESEVDNILTLRRNFFGDFFESRFRSFIQKNPNFIFIADSGEGNGKILGYAFAYPWKTGTGVVHHIFVYPEHQGKVENHLLNNIEQYFSNGNLNKIRVWAREDQNSLIKLLYELGYELDTELFVFENNKIKDTQILDEGNQDVRILDFNEKYMDDILEIEKRCFKPAWHVSRGEFLRYATRYDSWFCIALDKDKAVGYLQISASYDLGYLGRVAVLPQYQRKGIGTRLSAEAIKWFKKKETKKVKLRSPLANIPAHNLYKKFGFIEVGKEYDFLKNLE